MPHIMIVQSRYYEDIAAHLLSGTTKALELARYSYEIFDVAGALEIPAAIKCGSLRREGRGTDIMKFDGFIALGCVLRGETSHYDIVCGESARGLSLLAIDYDLVIGNAILTCETHEQALVRADPAQMNKGADAVAAVSSLLEIKRKLRVA
jgi:6,7-dimethyl-8-ribityllumazine synthase